MGRGDLHNTPKSVALRNREERPKKKAGTEKLGLTSSHPSKHGPPSQEVSPLSLEVTKEKMLGSGCCREQGELGDPGVSPGMPPLPAQREHAPVGPRPVCFFLPTAKTWKG